MQPQSQREPSPPARPVIGRDDLVTRVVEAIAAGPTLVLIEGEPGIGKTRLLREVLGHPDIADRRQVVGACPPLDRPFLLSAALDGVRRLRDRLGHADLRSFGLSNLCGALLPVFPEWAGELPPAPEPLDDSAATRHRLLRALTELVARLGADLVVIENAQWADRATIEWLLLLASDLDSECSLVVTYRPADVDRDSLLWGLTSRMPESHGLLRVAPGPLDVDQARRLIDDMLGGDGVSEELAALIHDHTDGVPLAVEATVRLLQDRDADLLATGAVNRKVLSELTVPRTIADSVHRRLSRLPPDAVRLLEAAAVLAHPADGTVLAEVAALRPERGEPALDAALESGILGEADVATYGFRYALEARAVLDTVPPSGVRTRHARAVASLLRHHPQDLDRLARHSRGAGDIKAWCRYGEASADRAVAAGDGRGAFLTLLELVEEANHPIDRHLRLADKLGDAWFYGEDALGEFADRVATALRKLLESAECGPRERGELRLRLGRALWSAGRAGEAIAEFEASVPDLEVHRPDLAVRSMLNLAFPFAPGWAPERHLRWLDRATELVDAAGSPVERAATAAHRSTLMLLFGAETAWPGPESPAGLTPSQRAATAARTLDHAIATVAWGRYPDARHLLDDARRIMADASPQALAVSAQVVAAGLRWNTGGWDGLLDEAAALAFRAVRGDERMWAYAVAGQLAIAVGSHAVAERHLRAAVDSGAGAVLMPQHTIAPAGLARLLLGRRRVDDALRVTEPVLAVIAEKAVWHWSADILGVHVESLLAAGRGPAAERLVDEVADWHRGRRIPASSSALAVCRGLLAQGDDPVCAAGLFADAARQWAQLPRPYDALLAAERQGRCLLGAGELSAAVALLRETEQRLRDLGASWDADRVVHTLREYNVEIARTWRRGPLGYGDELSPREIQVIEHAARGMTNKEIAVALFISPRTVGQHLSKAMQKTGVASRTALVVAATHAGLIRPPSPAGQKPDGRVTGR
ncbi:LuxR C-terminal-related transcriptional regulator [Actinophytocola sp. NPDC049390]|uniref:helix-turn-helix transcriptional regulator n=1 Tax=Actinophytocola sp. NPDC049390 TaxID=3363894 RepID=UPI0037B4B233